MNYKRNQIRDALGMSRRRDNEPLSFRKDNEQVSFRNENAASNVPFSRRRENEQVSSRLDNAAENIPISFRKENVPISLRRENQGGQHSTPIGTSTRDTSDRQRDAEALADFNAAWEQIKYGCVSGREW